MLITANQRLFSSGTPEKFWPLIINSHPKEKCRVSKVRSELCCKSIFAVTHKSTVFVLIHLRFECEYHVI